MSKPPRILIISSIFPPMRGPEGDHVMHLCRALEQHGYEVHLLTSTVANTKGNPRYYNTVEVWGWKTLLQIVRVIRRVKPDAIQLMYTGWMYKNHPMITLLPSVVKWIDADIEVVPMITNPLGSWKSPTWAGRQLWRVLGKLVGGVDAKFGTLLRVSPRIAVLSEHHLKTLVAIDPSVGKKSVLIPCPPILHISPVDEARRAQTRARFGVADDELLFTFFGYGYPSKGIETLIAAFGSMADRHPKWKLMFAGRLDFAPSPDGRPYRDVVLAAAEPWKSRLIQSEYDGFTDEGSAFLRAADICVLPFDGGIQLNNSSVAGASVHGLPIISTLQPNLESAFVSGENVLLVPPKNPELMAQAMEKLAEDAALRAKLSAGAGKLSREWFGWDRTLNLLFSEKISALSAVPV